MKEQIQDTGIRPWFADDLISIQQETLGALEAHYKALGGSFVIQGCEIENEGIRPGIAFISGKLRRFAGATGLRFPIYMIPKDEDVNPLNYQTGGAKPTGGLYGTELVEEMPSGDCIAFTQSGFDRDYFLALQKADRRFVSDRQISYWNSKADGSHTHTPAQIITDGNNRFVTDADINRWNSFSADNLGDFF